MRISFSKDEIEKLCEILEKKIIKYQSDFMISEIYLKVKKAMYAEELKEKMKNNDFEKSYFTEALPMPKIKKNKFQEFINNIKGKK